MTIEDDELLKEFVIESQEHLASVETQLLELESETEGVDVGKVNNVFRAIHSIKGVAGFLNLKTLESLAHREEEVLNKLRNSEVRPTSEVINTLLRASDCLKSLLDTIETSNEQDVSKHIQALERLMINPTNLFKGYSTPLEPDLSSSELVAGIEEMLESESQDKTLSADVLRDFMIESHDNLQQFESYLVALEQRPRDVDLLNSIFRSVHTLKGSSGFLGFAKLEAITHAAENLLSELRTGNRVLDAEITTALFSTGDLVRKHLENIEKCQTEGSFEADELIRLLTTLQVTPAASQTQKTESDIQMLATEQVLTKSDEVPFVAPSTQESVPVEVQKQNPAQEASTVVGAAESTIRVDVALLDKLMNRVGELVLARNQILQCSNTLADNDLQSATQHLNLITTELQEGVMKTRMQPIGNVWSKFPRLVRDLATICGKKVRIEMEGKETELDKTIIEAIKDPLTHLVRNNVDHGIESPEVRIANGKDAEGCLSLRAYHEGGQVNIEISDDGGGLNLPVIKRKALEKGLITAEQASRMQDGDAAQLIFLPGFSTAEKVSNVSGRGVGMDVVKTNIEKIGGTVDITTRSGEGTSIKIKIPLTLAIIPALIISNHGNRFAIPQVNLLELVRIETTDEKPGIEWVQGAPVYRLRGRLLPLVYLSKILKSKHPSEAIEGSMNIVVLRVDDGQFGLVVDRILDTEEIVVKPMAKQLKGVPVFAGATIMGDGKVALILDVLGLANSSQVVSKDRNRSLIDSSGRKKESSGFIQQLLVLGVGLQHRLALPISQVARLEQIPIKTIEFTNKREVVQYRGQILPLVRLADVFGIEEEEVPPPVESSFEMEFGDPLAFGEPIEELEPSLNIVVYVEDDRSYGLVVSRVIDIVETEVAVSTEGQCDGLIGSAIIHDRVTDLVDLPAIIKQRRFNSEHTKQSTL